MILNIKAIRGVLEGDSLVWVVKLSMTPTEARLARAGGGVKPRTGRVGPAATNLMPDYILLNNCQINSEINSSKWAGAQDQLHGPPLALSARRQQPR